MNSNRRYTPFPHRARIRLALSVFVLLIALAITACYSPKEAPTPPVTAEGRLTPLLGSTSAKSSQKLQKDIERLIKRSTAADADWGIYVAGITNSEELVSINADHPMRPASVLKLFTTAAAVDQLGLNYQYETKVLISGDVTSNTLDGDLIVVGSGDPSISGRPGSHNADTMEVLGAWAKAIQQAGIYRIAGRLVIEDTLFSRPDINDTWEIGDLSHPYAAPSTSFAVHENAYDYFVRPAAAVGAPAIVEILPLPDYFDVQNDIITVESGQDTHITTHPSFTTGRIHLSGRIAIDAKLHQGRGSVVNGSRYAAACLRKAFANVGLEIQGETEVVSELDPRALHEFRTSGGRRLLYTHRSPSLRGIIAVINKRSQNFYADMLFKTLGAHQFGNGGFDNGASAVKAYFQKVFAGDAAPTVIDGSGLSWQNLATPEQTTAILRRMAHGKEGVYFRSTLPVAGIDGTLEYRFLQSPVRGNLYGKTGYIDSTRTLAGLMTCRSGERLALAIFTNNYQVPTSHVSRIQEEICELLFEFER